MGGESNLEDRKTSLAKGPDRKPHRRALNQMASERVDVGRAQQEGIEREMFRKTCEMDQSREAHETSTEQMAKVFPSSRAPTLERRKNLRAAFIRRGSESPHAGGGSKEKEGSEKRGVRRGEKS